jgi:hypothetical protein
MQYLLFTAKENYDRISLNETFDNACGRLATVCEIKKFKAAKDC